MKKNLFTLILCILFISLNAQTYKSYIQNGDAYYTSKEYEKSVTNYKEAFKIETTNAEDLYNAACAASLAKYKTQALDWLSLSVDKGWNNINHMKTDSDLDNIHSEKEWITILDKLQKKLDLIEINYDKPLQKELITIFNDDQTSRNQYVAAQKKYGYQSKEADSLRKIVILKDSLNLIKIIKILDEKGWVGKDKVGPQANQTLFLVIQHSDLKIQEKYLPMMREALKKGNAAPSSLALLEDRVSLRQGRKQIYGSQIGTNPKTNKQYVLPLDDPDNVDKRRAEVGLGLLEDYVKNWNIVWDIDTYKKELPELEKISNQ